MSSAVPRPLLGVVLEKIAPKIGAKVIMEPNWNIVGQIIFKNGRQRYFRYSSTDLNPLGAALLAKDKDYANYFMNSMGYPSIEGRTFYSKDWAVAIGSDQGIDAAFEYAKTLSLPVIVKPNSGSQGSGVFLVRTKQEFYKGLRAIFKKENVALVQRYMQGRDYRIVVLDDEVVAAYERVPLSVVGNGKSTIQELLEAKAKKFVGSSRDIRIQIDDPRIVHKVRAQGLCMTSTPKKGEQIFLLENSNLSTGGEAIDVLEVLHPSYKKIAISLTKDMGLRLCGVDMMVSRDITQEMARLQGVHILEINASPGLDHYAKSGVKQREIVESIYFKVLQKLEKMQ